MNSPGEAAPQAPSGRLTGVAPDGSPVEVYRLLPAMGEPELIHGAVPAAATILELGCGAGRVTAGLMALGHAVTGVDESPAMLDAARVRAPTARFVQARLEDLDLGEHFDAVVLASHLVNDEAHPRSAYLATARRHLEPTWPPPCRGLPARHQLAGDGRAAPRHRGGADDRHPSDRRRRASYRLRALRDPRRKLGPAVRGAAARRSWAPGHARGRRLRVRALARPSARLAARPPDLSSPPARSWRGEPTAPGAAVLVAREVATALEALSALSRPEDAPDFGPQDSIEARRAA